MTAEDALRRLVFAQSPGGIEGVPAWMALIGDGPLAQYRCVYCTRTADEWPEPGITILLDHTADCPLLAAFNALGIYPRERA